MRVVRVTGFGGPEMLVPGEAADPMAGPGQVVVDVAVASMTFVETQIRRGTDRWHDRPDLPYVPGGLVAGQISEVGAGVDRAWLGTRVIAGTGDTGGFAQRAVADAGALFTVPSGLDLPEAITLFSDGSTAQGLIERTPVKPGDHVLVEAAAGGLGSLLVQLALVAGAQVIGAARGTRKLRVVRELGAHAAVDYAEPDWTGRVLELTGGRGPDVVFDGVGGPVGRAAFEVLAPGGRFSIHGASSGGVTVIDPASARERGVEVIGVEQLFGFRAHVTRWATEMMTHAAAGRIRPLIGQTFPLDHAADAHRAVEERTSIGKTLLLI